MTSPAIAETLTPAMAQRNSRGSTEPTDSTAAAASPHVVEIETFGRGGLTHYVDNLSRALTQTGIRVDVITAADAEQTDVSGDADTNAVVKHKVLARWSARQRAEGPPGRSGSVLRGIRRKVEALSDAVRTAVLTRRLRPNAVHLHSTNPIALVHLVLLRLSGQRVVSTAHQVTPHERSRWRWVEHQVWRAIHRLPQRLVAHSKFDRDRLISEFGVAQDRIRVIPHGEYGFVSRLSQQSADEFADQRDARAQLSIPDDASVALFFGYLREYKGLDLLLDAWTQVQGAVPNAHLAIAGDPVQLSDRRAAQLEERAQELGATTHFGYVPLDEIALWFAAADVLVLPYRRVSQSGVLYLALALGVPVIATRIGAWSEMLTDGRTARMVPKEDAPALAKAISEVLLDPELQSLLAQGGRALATEHSWPAIAHETRDWLFD